MVDVDLFRGQYQLAKDVLSGWRWRENASAGSMVHMP